MEEGKQGTMHVSSHAVAWVAVHMLDAVTGLTALHYMCYSDTVLACEALWARTDSVQDTALHVFHDSRPDAGCSSLMQSWFLI